MPRTPARERRANRQGDPDALAIDTGGPAVRRPSVGGLTWGRPPWVTRRSRAGGRGIDVATAPGGRTSPGRLGGRPWQLAAAFAIVAVVAAPGLAQDPAPQPSAGPQQPGLFKDLGHDIKGLTSTQSLVGLGTGLAMALTALTVDDYVAEHFSDARGTEEAFEAGDVLGGVPVQAGSAVAVYAFGRVFKKPVVAAAGADLVRAQILSQAITQGIKYSVRRTRPDGTNLSFPSGHTTTTFSTVTVLRHYWGWKVGIPGYGLATYVAASRIQSRRHYLSDVLFGAAIGTVVGRSTTIGHGRATFAPMPFIAPRVAGVIFVRTFSGR